MIEVHPTRSEYVLIGYSFGQIVLIDVTDPGKSLKVIKDHHKGSTIANLAFCEWQKSQKSNQEKVIKEEAQHEKVRAESVDLSNPYGAPVVGSAKLKSNKQSDLHAWMFISIDTNGKVLVNTIQKVMFLFKAYKSVLAESKRGETKFYSIAARFSSDLHP